MNEWVNEWSIKLLGETTTELRFLFIEKISGTAIENLPIFTELFCCFCPASASGSLVVCGEIFEIFIANCYLYMLVGVGG